MTDAFDPDDFDAELPPDLGIPPTPRDRSEARHPSNFDADGGETLEPDEEGDTLEPPGEGYIELQLAMGEADAALQKLGLYVEGTMPYPDPQHGGWMGVMVCSIGDVAFSDRVQNPEKYAVDKTFGSIEHDAAKDTFLDRRAQIEANIAAGRAPLDNGVPTDKWDDDDIPELDDPPEPA